MKPVIYLGSDHAGFDLKAIMREHLELAGYTVEDLGAHTLDPADDYPVYAEAVAEAVIKHPGSLGVLSCGNAEGVAIVANKFDGIRAGVGFSVDAARTMREDDAANIIAIPGRIQTPDDPLAILNAFLAARPSNAPRHERRRAQIAHIESGSQTREILPSVLVHSFEAFRERITNNDVRKHARMWHIDILDGSMFQATSWHDMESVATLEPLPPLELHLMIEQPVPMAKAWMDHASSVKRAIIHAEIGDPLPEVIGALRDLGLEVAIALNPETPVRSIENLVPLIDAVLIMGVHPGTSGQPFLGESILKKIADVHTRFPSLPIEVDGGITEANINIIAEAGAVQFSVASAIWNAEQPKEALIRLTSAH